MTASTAMKVRIEFAIPVDLTNMDSLTAAALAIETMKGHAMDHGDLIAATAKTGYHDFGEKGDPTDPDPDEGE